MTRRRQRSATRAVAAASNAERERFPGRQDGISLTRLRLEPTCGNGVWHSGSLCFADMKCSPGHLKIWLAACAAGSRGNRHFTHVEPGAVNLASSEPKPSERSLRRDQPEDSPSWAGNAEKVSEEGRKAPARPQPGLVAACARERAAGLTDSRPETHAEFCPAGATRCHSLPLAGRAILGLDLREWLFLLVTA
jgi:hypothetical protein